MTSTRQVESALPLWFLLLLCGLCVGFQKPATDNAKDEKEVQVNYKDLPRDLRKAIDDEIGVATIRAGFKGLFKACGAEGDLEKSFFYSGLLDSFPATGAQAASVYLVKPGGGRSVTRERVLRDERGRVVLRYTCIETDTKVPFVIISSITIKDAKPVVSDRIVYYDPDMPWGLTKERAAKIRKQIEE
jgi:hypothetical protein